MLVHLLSYLLASMGLTILIVWPADGPTAWFREKILRRLMPGKIGGVLDCYICMGFWSGLGLSALWWRWQREPWIWTGCLMVPAAFWILLGLGKSDR